MSIFIYVVSVDVLLTKMMEIVNKLLVKILFMLNSSLSIFKGGYKDWTTTWNDNNNMEWQHVHIY